MSSGPRFQKHSRKTKVDASELKSKLELHTEIDELGSSGPDESTHYCSEMSLFRAHKQDAHFLQGL